MSNTGLIRQLKKITQQNKENEVFVKKSRNIGRPSFWSFLAIIISLISIYLQFFYINYDLRLNLVDGFIKNDTLRCQIIYHNRGNQDATVLNSKIELYPKNQKKKNSIKLPQRKIPLIISNGNQKYEEMKFSINFNNYNLDSWGYTVEDTLAVELIFEFLNDNNYRSDKRIICGWIKLDSLQKIEYYLSENNSVELKSNKYYTNSYNYD
ncbi:hypothetical protein ACFSKN_10460 [Mariniflexile gromovii]|uniref:Uncharacterized protein n=1 Tax=Mariniflexile gromovii TaxID=362523 RepID=A0ABS4BVX0_9FLAO|nr:hypothetical protein [Mariniflexile gromovii]MBP0904717.1 hypothetical protein [Mariniflexile gromovii]